ncbi:MAG TPA: transposase [Nitrolancea sp.]|nr:transposase [Nitrolancea sp.]
MDTLPPAMITLVAPFAPLFSDRVWRHALVLVAGTLLAPGKRTVCAALRAMGLSGTRQFARYHRVLNRATWSSLAVSRVLLGLLVAAFAPTGPVVVGVDETIERRWGAQIAAKGLYRDAVRSSKGYFVKVSGLRWLCLMLLVPLPWAERVWALPFLTILAPSERHDRERGRRHKKLTDWARQALLLLRRWLPQRALVVVADSGYAAIELLTHCTRLVNPITVVTRLRLDAALYEPAPPRRPGQNGRPRKKGRRLPTLAARIADPVTAWTPVVVNWYGEGARVVEVASDTAVWYHSGLPPVPLRWVLVRDPQGRFDTQALLCTDLAADPAQILAWFVLRWQLEVTFEEVRRHLGVETQRQWSERAILRTTPALLGLFSLVTLWAHPRIGPTGDRVRQAAWYHKPLPTFSDALALVRRELWGHLAFCMSDREADLVKVPRALIERFADALCYAA